MYIRTQCALAVGVSVNEADRTENPAERTILLASANRYLGYANGINRVLVAVGFKHDRMKVLEDLLGF